MEGEHQHEQVPVIQPVIDTGEKELIDPVLNLTERTTRVEERQAQHQQEMLRQLQDLEGRLVTATGSQVGALEHRIATLEGKIERQADIPDETVELTLPDVETSPAPPEKMRQGLIHRRKAKRSKK